MKLGDLDQVADLRARREAITRQLEQLRDPRPGAINIRLDGFFPPVDREGSELPRWARRGEDWLRCGPHYDDRTMQDVVIGPMCGELARRVDLIDQRLFELGVSVQD